MAFISGNYAECRHLIFTFLFYSSKDTSRDNTNFQLSNLQNFNFRLGLKTPQSSLDSNFQGFEKLNIFKAV